MALIDGLTNIADAIRSKTGETDKLSIESMARTVSLELERKQKINHASIPEYVKVEAMKVAQKVESVRKEDSIVFLAMSDSHYDGASDQVVSQITASNRHALMGAKVLAYLLDLDFVAHLGDVTLGSSTTMPHALEKHHKEFFKWWEETERGVPHFRAIGNHDTGIYYHEEYNKQNPHSPANYLQPPEYLYEVFTYSPITLNSLYHEGDKTYGGYKYIDLYDRTADGTDRKSKNFRVYLLNTSEGIMGADSTCSTEQLRWLAINLRTYGYGTGSSFIILSHYPADYGSTMPLSDLLRAYVEGGEVEFENADGSVTWVDFNGCNRAKFVAQFHGHLHNFLATQLSTGNTPETVETYDAWRICIPNSQPDRENYYDEKELYTSDQSYYYIPLKDEVTCHKTPDTAEDTSFVVNVINPSEQKIYSFCYGAGYDRVIGYGGTVYHTVHHSLNNAVITNEDTSVQDGFPYSTYVESVDDCSLVQVKVTMGGEDITDIAYSQNSTNRYGTINIESVTGNIVITAVAAFVFDGNNLVKSSKALINTDDSDLFEVSGEVFNGGLGYKNGTRLSGANNDQELAGYVVTGYIPYSRPIVSGSTRGDFPTIYIKGATLSTALDKVRFVQFQETDTEGVVDVVGEVKGDDWLKYFESIEELGENYYKLNPVQRADTATGKTPLNHLCCGLRFSLQGYGESLIITVDEPIE